MKLALQRLADRYTLHRLSSGSPLPAGLTEEPFYAVLRSDDELSVCCRERLPVASDRREDGWAAMRVAGPLDFALTGIVAGLTAPLAEAGIPVFVISSFDTDYLLVKADRLAAACEVLIGQGATIDGPVESR